ncbi:MAG: sulfatase-like hydrolase/transferase [Acidobacteriota bacterium]|nr:sulfatase-like hydrolase/transferase [Acidobacteriota bacterium]
MAAPQRLLARALIALVLVAGCRRGAETATHVSFPGAPVILISIDTLRADHLPAWGYDGVKTPAIDRLRDDGVLFRNAYSQVPLTLPSHVSLLTGLLPASHGVRDNIGYRLAPNVATLPATLKRHGYATGAAVSAYVLRGTTGLREQFDSYDDGIAFTPGADLGAIQRPGAATVAAAKSWIAPRANSRFFFFLHLFEPHTPYDAPEPYRSAAASRYDADIAQADAILGDFLDELRRTGVYDRAIIILVSDHGEGLGDHGEREHGIFVYRETIHVPMIVKMPRNSGAGSEVESPVALVDVFPTVLSLAGLQQQPALAGMPLLGPSAPQPVQERRIFSESLYARLHLGWSDVRSLISSEQHFIEAPRAELYMLRDDPREQRNVIADERRAAASFRNELARFEKKITAPGPASSEDAKKLAALGYISAPASTAEGDLPDAKDRIGDLEQYAAANDALARGEVQTAIGGFKALLEHNPQFTDAALGLARAYESAKQYSEAGEVYRGLLARNPALTEQVAIGVATAFLNAGKLEEARAHAALALSSNPGAAHLLLGQIALAANTPREAQRHANEAMRDAHYAAQAVVLLSTAFLKETPPNAAGALRALDTFANERAARGERPVAAVEVARASALMRLSRPADAERALRTAIEVQPQNADAYARLAAIHLTQHNLPAAEAVLSQMVAASPGRERYELAANTLAFFGQAEAANEWRRRYAQQAAR